MRILSISVTATVIIIINAVTKIIIIVIISMVRYSIRIYKSRPFSIDDAIIVSIIFIIIIIASIIVTIIIIMKITFVVAASTSKDKHAKGQLLIWQNFLNNSLIRQNFLNFLIGQNQIRTFSSS